MYLLYIKSVEPVVRVDWNIGFVICVWHFVCVDQFLCVGDLWSICTVLIKKCCWIDYFFGLL